MKVLISGGAGFVGRRFTCRLLDDGHEVTVVDNLSAGLSPEQWAFKPRDGAYSFKFIQADLRDWVRYTPNDEFDLVIHCAAVVGGRLKIEGDPMAVATDLAIDSDFFQWVVKATREQKVIYFSSSAVYPVELQQKFTKCALTESLVGFDTPRFSQPDKTYGWAKLTGEYLARQAVFKYKKDVLIYRPFSGYGEDQALDYPFPSIIQRVARRENPIVVWGSGEQLRDFIHIDDVVEAVLVTKDQLVPGDVINLGSGQGTPFKELAGLACEIAGHEAPIVSDTTKPSGVYSRVADTHKLVQYYAPKITLKEGVQRALDFYRKAL